MSGGGACFSERDAGACGCGPTGVIHGRLARERGGGAGVAETLEDSIWSGLSMSAKRSIFSASRSRSSAKASFMKSDRCFAE